MDALSATASIIAILQLSAKVLSYLNDVKDASKGHAQCAIEASNIHNLLTKLRFRLEEGHSHQSWFTEVQALAVENGPLDQFKQALETLQTKMTDGGRLKKVGEALIWKFRKEEVDAILVQMERLKTLIEIALLMDHFKLSQAIKDDMDSIRTDVSAIQSTIDKFQHTQATASQRAILDWLSSSDYPAQQSDIIKRRQEGTGQWFLDAPEVARWLNEPKSTLFCPGIPGAGKTMLAAIAVEQLLAVAQNNSYGVAYVYCNYKSQADQDTAGLLTAILKQLVQGRASALGPVKRLHQKHANRGTKPSLDDVYRALDDVLALYPYVYIVVDALDECQEETRRQLLPKLLDLQNRADVRLLATSRFARDVDNAFQSALRLEVQASDEDVKQFVAGQIHRLPRGVQRDVTLQKLVQKRVIEAVGGMFLLARLHMDSLSDNTTLKEVKSTLATLSTGVAGLDDAYSKALERIEGQRTNYARLAKKILTWITLAKRSLTTDEICCALAVEPGGNEIDPDNMPDVDDIVSVCAGLVVVDQESAVIRLVHYTTQNYFESISPRMSPDGQLHITATCLTYLSFSVFKSGSCATNKEFEERLCQHKLLDYAARHCGEHARHVEAEVAEAICSYVTHNGLLACAAEVLYAGLSYNYNEYSKTYTTFTALHWASRFGLCKIAKGYLRMKAEDTVHAVHAQDRDGHSLMHATEHKQDTVAKLLLDKDKVDVNAKDYSGQTPLSLAAAHGHDAVVQLLLSIDEVDADTRDNRGRTPLSWAASSGSFAQDTVAKLLLNTDRVDANTKDYGGRSPLSLAAESESDAVVQLLLSTGEVDADTRDNRGRTPLSWAASSGSIVVAKLLLATGRVDVNAPNEDGWTPLSEAASHGQDAVVRLLLNTDGVDVNIKDHQGRTPLSLAAEFGRDAIVQLLLSTDEVDADTRDNRGRTPLSWAASSGSIAVAKLLLATSRVNVNAPNEHGWTPLLEAAYHGRDAVVKLLLNTDGQDVHVKDCSGKTPLSLALEQGHEAIVQLLLSTGQVNVNALKEDRWTPLLEAASYGRDAEVKLLLNTDRVDVYTKDHQGRTPLSLAAAHGHNAVVKLLLNTDEVDVNAKDYQGRTPLSLAAESGRDAVVQLLLSTDKVDANTRDNHGRTPLSWAASSGSIAVAKLLLATGRVNVNAPNEHGWTPLLEAASHGRDAVVKLLLNTDGIDVHTKDYYRRTPLSLAATHGHDVVVQLLLSTDEVDADIKDNRGRTPLSWAASSGSITVVKLLLATGQVNVNAPNEHGWTPLLEAAYHGRDAVVKLLLNTDGQDMLVKDCSGKTPLSLALEQGHEAVVKLLCNTGKVNVGAKDHDG